MVGIRALLLQLLPVNHIESQIFVATAEFVFSGGEWSLIQGQGWMDQGCLRSGQQSLSGGVKTITRLGPDSTMAAPGLCSTN